MSTKMTLTGVVKTWKLNGRVRKFAEVTLPYKTTSQMFQPVQFDAFKNRGEQRTLHTAHVRKLKKAMEDGTYTPTPASAGLSKEHFKAVKHQKNNGVEQFSLVVDSSKPLPLTDGGHRLAAINTILSEVNSKLERATDPATKRALQTTVEEINDLPITCTIYLDGETQHDFVNLQEGRPLDASHLFSLKVQQNLFGDSTYSLAFEVAKILHGMDDSPFNKSIRFDSRGLLPLPINTLCSRGSSDSATSLVGLAKIGANRFDATKLAQFVTNTHRALKSHAPDLLEEGKVLTPIYENGTRGSATMLISLAICLAHSVASNDQPNAEATALTNLVEAAKETLDEHVDCGFSGQFKRERVRRFAASFFANYAFPRHQGIPIDLLRKLAASAFGVTPVPKALFVKKDVNVTKPAVPKNAMLPEKTVGNGELVA